MDQGQAAVVGILEEIGEDPKREGLIRTPERHMNFLREFIAPPVFKMTTFQNEGIDEMIVETGIPFYSLCEHHILPFFGTATIAYIPKGKIVGLSKLPRLLEKYARRLQNQERITTQVAGELHEKLQPLGVAVLLRARHLCMEMRGVRTHGVETVTSCLVGQFKDDAKCRSEFLSIANG